MVNADCMNQLYEIQPVCGELQRGLLFRTEGACFSPRGGCPSDAVIRPRRALEGLTETAIMIHEVLRMRLKLMTRESNIKCITLTVCAA